MPDNLPAEFKSRRNLLPAQILTPQTNLNFQNAGRWIQIQKVERSRLAIDRLRADGRMPANDNEIFSYLGRSGSSRQFKNIGKFWSYNIKNPGLFARSWRYEPITVGTFEDMKAAADYAYRRCLQNSLKHTVTYRYRKSFLYLYRTERDAYPRAVLGRETAILEDPTAELIIVNAVDYASSLEAHAFERAKNGGIMYEAARSTARAFRNINVRFSYTNLDKLGLNLSHRYAVPYIRISLRQGTVKPYFSRPGRNIRRRGSAYAKRGANERAFYQYNTAMRNIRRRTLKRQDDRHFGDDLYSYQRFRARLKRRQ